MSDDNPRRDPMRVEQAMALLADRYRPVSETEILAVADALGRVLAEDVVSTVNVPPHDNSAMDGWGFAAAARPADGCMEVIATVAAGHPFGATVPAGKAVRILTGAPVPDGIDTVAMQEKCRADGTMVEVPGLRPGANIRAAGEDVASGETVLCQGTRLRPQDLGICSAIGRTTLTVYRPITAAVFSTGDEVREPGVPLPPGCIYDSNRTTAAALLRSLGVVVTDLGLLPDNRQAIVDALSSAAAHHDVVLTSGGVSTGDADFVKAAVTELGSLDFWRLAIKPGSPLALGRIGDAAFLGLPGNPVAVMVTFMLVARPLVLRLMGMAQADLVRYPVVAGFSFPRKTGRREWLRAQVRAENGRLVAEIYGSNGSGVLSSMVWSDGLVELPEECGEVKHGDVLAYIPYAEVLR